MTACSPTARGEVSTRVCVWCGGVCDNGGHQGLLS